MKNKNEFSIEKSKVYTPKSLTPTPLTTFQPFNMTTNINMWKKKRINTNTEELNEKIKDQMKKKFGDQNKFFKEHLFTSEKTNCEIDIDAEIQNISSGIEGFSLTKRKNLNSNVEFKIPQKKNKIFNSKNKAVGVEKILFKNEKLSTNIKSIITKTKEERELIEKENKVFF